MFAGQQCCCTALLLFVDCFLANTYGTCLAGLTDMWYRYFTSLTYPVIDSFPRIFPDKGEAQDTTVDGQTGRLPVSTRLASSSGAIPRLKSIKNAVSRAIGVHEREPILNDLGEFVEAYEVGWNSGSDDDDD